MLGKSDCVAGGVMRLEVLLAKAESLFFHEEGAKVVTGRLKMR